MPKPVLHVLGLLGLLPALRSYGQAPVKVLVYPGTELVEVVQLLTCQLPFKEGHSKLESESVDERCLAK